MVCSFPQSHSNLIFLLVNGPGHIKSFQNGQPDSTYGSDAPEISYEEFGTGHTLFALDLSPDLSALDGSHFNLIKNGSMRINLRFENALDRNMSLVVFAVFQNIIEIDKSRNITTDY